MDNIEIQNEKILILFNRLKNNIFYYMTTFLDIPSILTILNLNRKYRTIISNFFKEILCIFKLAKNIDINKRKFNGLYNNLYLNNNNLSNPIHNTVINLINVNQMCESSMIYADSNINEYYLNELVFMLNSHKYYNKKFALTKFTSYIIDGCYTPSDNNFSILFNHLKLSNLTSLKIDDTYLSHNSCIALGSYLESATSLNELFIGEKKRFSSIFWTPIFDSLSINKSIVKLKIIFLDVKSVEEAISIAKFFESNDNIRELNIDKLKNYSNEYYNIVADGLKGSKYIEKLELEVIDSSFDLILKAIQNFREIKSLHLKKFYVEEDGLNIFYKLLENNKNLEFLNISNFHLGDDSLKLLVDSICKCEKLKELNLNNNNLSILGIKHLSDFLSHNNSLEKLLLSKNNYSIENNLSVWEFLKFNSTLKYLDLSNTNIMNNEVIKIIQVLKLNKGIKVLDIRLNKLNDEIGTYLLDLLNENQTIERIFLRGNFISEEVLMNIENRVFN